MEDDEKEPLLLNIEQLDKNNSYPRHRVTGLKNDNGLVIVRGGLSCDPSPVQSVSSYLHLQDERIVGLFVVAFDTRSGNVIEWSIPEGMDLTGVEFKAMTSGSHTLQNDFVYFKKRNLYGLACFENMKVESTVERGARMKSVGILSTSYTLLHKHMQFLENQVRHQLEVPGQYNQLEAFYNDKKATLSDSVDSILQSTLSDSHINIDVLPELKITHPAGCFSQFFKFFGEQIFVLWKYVLLRKRILFFSPPPIGVVCYRVYCCCCLGNHSVNVRVSSSEVKPHFYVNVADIDTLESELSYIACTTEKIFESKANLYDVYIDNQNVHTKNPALKDLLKLSSADRDKLDQLSNLRSDQLFSIEVLQEETIVNEEEIFTKFFTEQNNRIFQTLLDISQNGDRTITSDHMRSMGLDPLGDRTFLMELVETYGIDVVLMVDNPCCPT